MSTPDIGKHLASLNLFRESDGSLHITVAGATGAIEEMKAKGVDGRPVDYVDRLIVAAAANTRTAVAKAEALDQLNRLVDKHKAVWRTSRTVPYHDRQKMAVLMKKAGVGDSLKDLMDACTTGAKL